MKVLKDRKELVLTRKTWSNYSKNNEFDLGARTVDTATEAKKTGHAGTRLACGVSGISSPF